ncbi:LacI family DNA-binding transcriptional regulator [Paenibacillus dakarensis]|uniref:LacI family DNA-binding transcriptional regulator n=1 Tax=Paenibacillus dakarensis TaxID=1527293 RepID=UPI0006D53AD6|nr:LacI family DNA-binding transcriptional regulator [Paenibacillus dakarensis]
MKTTIADIAKIAEVAKSTVSRYLNGGSVSNATRKKLDQVIQETGYSPNTFAQSLKAKKTNMIGAIVPRLDSFSASQSVTSLDEELRAHGYQLLIVNTSQDLSREIEAIYDLARQKISGIILFATQITEAHMTAFEQIKIPVILLGQQHKEVHSMIYDDYSAGYEIGKYVLQQGHREIAYLGVTEQDIAVGVKRKQGFQEAVRQKQDVHVDFYESGFKMSDAVVSASSILDKDKPSIIVCATDNIALGVMKAAYMRGIHIPEQLSVTGFGGYDITEVIHPSLTTVKYGYSTAGKLAAKNIMRLVSDKEVEPLTVMGCDLLIRESVDKI